MKLSRLGYFTGKAISDIVRSFPGTNVVHLGFFIALILFVALNRLFPPQGLGEGTHKHDEDTLILPSAYRQDIPTQGQYSALIEGEVAITTSGDDMTTDAAEKKEH